MKAIASALIICLTATTALAQPAPAATTTAKPVAAKPAAAPSLSTRMDRLAKFYVDNNQFMGTVLVAQGDRILLNKGYGFANLEWKIPNTPDTKFRLGSITKQFTAAAILILEERGKLSIDDLVKKHMPDAPAAWDKITIKHVLSHTAGIPNFTNFPDYAKTKYTAQTPLELIARFKDRALEFEPGARWNYSNSGYVLLGYLVEKISGESYEKFVTDNIFTPLAMRDSGYDSNTAVIARRASGYAPANGVRENADFVHMSIPHGAGALYSTTGDLLRWERGLFGGKLLKPETVTKMTTMVKDDYALGIGVRVFEKHKVIEHNGGIEGFNTVMSYYPDEKLTVIALANQNGPGGELISRKLALLAMGDKVVLPSERNRLALKPGEATRYVGAYQMGPAMTRITADGNRLYLQAGQSARNEMFAESRNRFYLAVPDADVEFAGDAAQAGELAMHMPNGNINRGKRVSEDEVKRAADALAARRAARIADPRTEPALRKNIADLLAGTPDYENMSTALANVTRQQLPQLRNTLGGLGALKTITFTEVGPAGADVYKVEFEKGNTTWRIIVQEDGKIASLGFGMN